MEDAQNFHTLLPLIFVAAFGAAGLIASLFVIALCSVFKATTPTNPKQ